MECFEPLFDVNRVIIEVEVSSKIGFNRSASLGVRVLSLVCK